MLHVLLHFDILAKRPTYLNVAGHVEFHHRVFSLRRLLPCTVTRHYKKQTPGNGTPEWIF